MIYTALAALLAIQIAPVPDNQSLARQQMDDLGRHVAASTQCHQLGYAVSPLLLEAVRSEISTPQYGQPDPSVRERWLTESAELYAAEVGHLMLAASDAAIADPPAAQPMHQMVEWFDRACASAAASTVTRDLITAPPGFDRSAGRRRMADEYLQDAGIASWQSPAIAARGDVFMVLGACHATLTEARMGTLRNDAMPPASARTSREREFYERRYQQGVTAADSMGLDADQCERGYRTLSATAASASTIKTDG